MLNQRPSAIPIFRCSRLDVLIAFAVVGQEIRSKCHRYAKSGLTQREAWDLARRIKDQRDLIWQVVARRNTKHVRRLLRLNTRLRQRALGIIERAGLDKSVLVFK
jgi:hypothetical protein